MLYTPSSPDATFVDLQRHEEELLQEQEELRNTREELRRVQQDLQRARLALGQREVPAPRDTDATPPAGAPPACHQEIALKEAHAAALQRRIGASAATILALRRQIETTSGRPAPAPTVSAPGVPSSLQAAEPQMERAAPASVWVGQRAALPRPPAAPAAAFLAIRRALLVLSLSAPFVLMYFLYVYEVSRLNR